MTGHYNPPAGQLDGAMEFIRDRIATYGYPPSIREIAAAIGVSVSTAHAVIRHLEDSGRITRDLTKSRAIRVEE